MKKIIINADDLGISIDVNQAIEEAIQKGVISSATILVNGPAYEDAIRIAHQYPNISFGVHLNLIEFSPLTNKEIFAKYNLINADGNFIEGAIFAIKRINKELKVAVFEEFDAQIAKFKMSGLIPSHVDSHQHAHTRYELKHVLYEIMKRHDISKVRRTSSLSIRLIRNNRKYECVKLDKSNAVVVKKKNILWRRLNFVIRKIQSYLWNSFFQRKMITTDAFYAYRIFYYNLKLLNKKNKEEVIELMCHPGHFSFQKETELLTKSILSEILSYELITYNDLN